MKPWTPEDVAVLREGAAAGLSFAQVAAGLGRSRGAVAGKADRLGVCFAMTAAKTPSSDEMAARGRKGGHASGRTRRARSQNGKGEA